jgi:hypothetical protein
MGRKKSSTCCVDVLRRGRESMAGILAEICQCFSSPPSGAAVIAMLAYPPRRFAEIQAVQPTSSPQSPVNCSHPPSGGSVIMLPKKAQETAAKLAAVFPCIDWRRPSAAFLRRPEIALAGGSARYVNLAHVMAFLMVNPPSVSRLHRVHIAILV